jgi:hypothetical protein
MRDYDQPLRYDCNGELSVLEIAHHLYMNKGWVVEYANEDGVFGNGVPGQYEERFTWEDNPDEAVTHADLVARRAELGPVIEMARLRYVRDEKLAETDWWAVGDRTMTAEQTAYRQALRDLPANTTDPKNPVWPTKPT